MGKENNLKPIIQNLWCWRKQKIHEIPITSNKQQLTSVQHNYSSKNKQYIWSYV